MTYCLGIVTKYGLVMASDSRTNAGSDQINVGRKMHVFELPGQCVYVFLSAGSLSCTQSILTLLRRDFDAGRGLASAANMYDAAREVGRQVRAVADLDRESLERDKYQFNVNLLMGGQVKGEEPQLFLIYPQGNPLQAGKDTPYLQIGETKYGRPILDRGIRYEKTTLEEAAKYALLSLDSTMKSNVTVGPPIDLLAYEIDALRITHRRRFGADDPDLQKIRGRWEQALQQAVLKLPNVRFRVPPGANKSAPSEESIQLVEPAQSEPAVEQVSQKQPKTSP
jgi:putative proteasome-type protease